MQQEKPNLILSFGGYTSVPVIFAAVLRNIPIVVHEQTLHAGLANRIASPFAKKVCISWQPSEKYFPKQKIVLTGNPIRLDVMMKKDFFATHTIEKSDAQLPIIYITGGSLGSHAINEFIQKIIEKLLKKYVVIHQTGASEEYKDFDQLEKLKNSFPIQLQKRYILTKFVEVEMIGSLLKKADLVVARAGINTVSEMLYFGKPTLFIPLPFAQKNEQMENALFFKKQGLGEVFSQDSLTANKLYEHIISMVTHKDRYTQYAARAQEHIHKDAVKKILAVCENLMI